MLYKLNLIKSINALNVVNFSSIIKKIEKQKQKCEISKNTHNKHPQIEYGTQINLIHSV